MSQHVFDVTGPLPERTIVLEASAGTGKTYAIAALAARFVADGVRLHDMMIVTFSRMATQELRSRVRDRLEEVARALEQDDPTKVPGLDPVTRLLVSVTGRELSLRQTRFSEALAEFDTATIATTHEFCHRMLGGLGSLAPQDALPTFVADLSALVREVALDVWLQLFAESRDRQAAISPAEALAITKQVLLHPDAVIGPEGAPGDRAQLRLTLARRAREEALRRKARRGLSTYDDMMGALLEALDDPELGTAARERLSRRYPVVLIDEFQDTDPQQWRIIEKAFIDRSRVVLIGDPKQAIYAFRGADVLSYLEAVSRSRKQSLSTNWRSDASLVDTLNELLGGTALGHGGIVVRPVQAKHAEPRLLVPQARWQAPVRLRAVLPPDPDELPRADAVRALIDRDLCQDVRGLLAAGATVAFDDTVRALRKRDIAVLVSSNRAGARVQAALAGVGIPALFTGAQSVWTTTAARDWLHLLTALTNPTPVHVSEVALTAFHGWDFAQLAKADAADLTGLGAKVRGWAATLRERGVAGLMEQVLGSARLLGRLLDHADGQRVLTDLRHVGQQLAAAQAQGVGPVGLVDWLADRLAEAVSDADEAPRRLETDEDAVQIMTIHRAKGLEFPIVYLPEAADRWVPDSDEGQPFIVHESADGGRRIVDVVGLADGPARAERRALKAAEDAGEELRKLYVALTRAQCQVTLWWAPSHGNHQASALQRVLFRDRGGVSSPEPRYDHTDLAGAHLPEGVAVQRVEDDTHLLEHTDAPSNEVFQAREFTREIDTVWRRTSYSGLTAGTHGLAVAVADAGVREDDEPEMGLELDAATADQVAATSAGDDDPSPMAAMAGGTQFGSLVHAVLEHVDPMAADLETELGRVVAQQLARVPVAGLAADELVAALGQVLATPLGPLAGGRTLADIPVSDRLPELDFELPLGSDERHARLRDLADLMAEHLPGDDILAGYPDALRAEGLGEQTLRGFLTGSIDALLRVGDEPRHLVVDYKTNRLGPLGAPLRIGHYTPPAMAEAMIASHYPLQALLYAVATHRFLRWRLPDYRPERHLGGVLYLFVRGMAGPRSDRGDGTVLGVFSWRPPAALVVALSDRIGGRG